jgi:NTP pyrophosphatase (non-canonical NTP hydrolase)
MADINQLTDMLIQFRDERNWAQFHTLKDLIISLNLEASELLELTQWKSDSTLESAKADTNFRESLKDECADVLLYLLLIADHAGIDLLKAAEDKIHKNAVRYPVSLSYGTARKHSEPLPPEEPKANKP